jgi:two-component system, LytTR family, response regulator
MTSNKIKVLVVDDETLTREELIKALNETDEFGAEDSAASISEAYDIIKERKYDLVFLDIMLSDGVCFSLINKLKKENMDLPPIVIVTGRTEFQYAQKIFNDYKEDVIYLLNKPFWSTWIDHREKIIEAFFGNMKMSNTNSESIVQNEFISIPSGRKSYHIKFKDIIHIKTGEKMKGITEIHLVNNKLQCNLALVFLANKLPHSFCQINRFEIINTEHITYIEQTDKEVFLSNGYSTFISPNFYKNLADKI